MGRYFQRDVPSPENTMAETHPENALRPSRTSLKKSVTRRILPRPSGSDQDSALFRQLLLLMENRRGLLERLEEASGERARLQEALGGRGWRRGLFCAPVAGLGAASQEASRRMLDQCTRNKQLEADLEEAERRLEWAECGLVRVRDNLAVASRRVGQQRAEARHMAHLTAELRAAAADAEAALALAQRRRRALSRRLRYTNRAVERALMPDDHRIPAFEPLKPGQAAAYKALQLRVKQMDLEQQLEKQERRHGVAPPSVMDVALGEELEAESLLRLQEEAARLQRLADGKEQALQEARLRVHRLQRQLAQVTATARQELDSEQPLMGGLEAAWREQLDEFAERLRKMEEHEEACLVAEGVLDTALSLSASTTRAMSDELQFSECEVSALSTVAVSLLSARDEWKAPTVEEYLGAQHYYELVVAAKARREQLLLAVENLWLRLREAEARSRQINAHLQADQRLASALDARLMLCQQNKALSSLSVGGEATTVRNEFLEAEAREARVAVALAEEETARLDVVCSREVARVRLLYEQAIGLPLYDPSAAPAEGALQDAQPHAS